MAWPIVVRRVSGISMSPALTQGEIIVGWRWWRYLQPGRIVVFTHDGKEKVKRISAVDGDFITVVGDNSAHSTDSRQFGPIVRSEVLAIVLWPLPFTVKPKRGVWPPPDLYRKED